MTDDTTQASATPDCPNERLVMRSCPGCGEAADEIDRLRQVARNVYEVWAGSEGIPLPETAVEAYLLQLVKQMRDEAKNAAK